jgi:hypothetical protein
VTSITDRSATHRAAAWPTRADPNARDRAIDGMSEGVTELRDQVHGMVMEIKPRLRGWLHAAIAPLALVAGIVLIEPHRVKWRLGCAVSAVAGSVFVTVVEIFVLGWWEVAAPGVQALLVVPVDPLEGGVLDVVEAAPGTATSDELGLVEAVEGLGCGVVEGVALGADRGDRTCGGEAFGVADREVLGARSEWCTRPATSRSSRPRCHRLCSRASRARSARSEFETRQPTMRRE